MEPSEFVKQELKRIAAEADQIKELLSPLHERLAGLQTQEKHLRAYLEALDGRTGKHMTAEGLGGQERIAGKPRLPDGIGLTAALDDEVLNDGRHLENAEVFAELVERGFSFDHKRPKSLVASTLFSSKRFRKDDEGKWYSVRASRRHAS